MKEFAYVIKDELGIHARPAGMFVKEAARFQSNVTLTKGEKTVDAKRIIAVMSLGTKCGDEITLRVDGDDEDTAFDTLKSFLEENL
ncbi:MAG: HPr family phosphocarrier protein [Eubacteriales bacterium]|nr:HPr family phosphocarrier protein [Eubacteriales bacterium]